MATTREPVRRRKAKLTVSPLVDDVTTFFARFLIMSEAQRLVIALWVIHTHLIENVEQTPYLAITSPESECAKSRVLEVLEVLVSRPWMISRPSEAVLYRQLDTKKPTLLLDEIDTMLSPKQAHYHEGLRAVLDTGHRRRTAVVPRAKDFGKGVEHFRTFGAKAFAGIGTLPDTIARRSIYIRMERKRKDEPVDKFLHRDAYPAAEPLRTQIVAWAQEHGEQIASDRPAMPDELSDRMQEGCESLVAIADALGCGGRARVALVELLAGDRLDTHETMGRRLLRDLYDIWKQAEQERGRTVPAIPSWWLLQELRKLETSPWGGYYGRGLEANDLASLLRQYNVTPKNVKIKDKVPKGYRRDDLYTVFERYVSSEGSGGSGAV